MQQRHAKAKSSSAVSNGCSAIHIGATNLRPQRLAASSGITI
jgi:hypothetical protein